MYGEEEGDDAPLAPFDVMLTCYTLFERDSEQQRLDRSFLRSWRWSHLILDEAHAVMPPGTELCAHDVTLYPPFEAKPCAVKPGHHALL